MVYAFGFKLNSSYTLTTLYNQNIFLLHLQNSFILYLKALAQQQIILWLLHKSITPMTSYLLINNIWPESAEWLATRPITIHEFYSTWMDCLNK